MSARTARQTIGTSAATNTAEIGPGTAEQESASAKRGALRRAARRELEAAKALGGRRVHRERHERAPDVEPIRLPSGLVVFPEVKTRTGRFGTVYRALGQVRTKYVPRGTPMAVAVAVISSTGAEALAVLSLRDLSRLLGVLAARGQLPLMPGEDHER